MCYSAQSFVSNTVSSNGFFQSPENCYLSLLE